MSDLEDNSQISRPSKRRKCGHGSIVNHCTDEESCESLSDSQVSPEAVSRLETKTSNDPDAANPKKPKYRIHVPKNADLPEDTFLTQPPAGISSPYRIEKFYWQKPRRASPPSSAVALCQEVPNRLEERSDFRDLQPRLPISDSNAKSASSAAQVSHRRVIYNSQPQKPNSTSLISEVSSATVLPCKNPLNYKEVSGPVNSHEDVLADLPSDAFSSPEPEPILVSSQPFSEQEVSSQFGHQRRLAAPLVNLKQTTLFGDQAEGHGTQSQSSRRHAWPLANREEPPTHHKLNAVELETWVYPTNLGTIRDYQYSIVARGLYHNMLVALPTGLGKTFIAATIMLNWFRWTTDAQIVFVAPTRPLVSQQVKACFEIAGIPRASTTMLTGGTPPGIRAEEWQSKRVFFMTPQTIVNDLKTGICDPKRLVLLVVDEAHRATGGYAYVEAVQFIRRFNTSFRVLALTATPGASIEAVQEVIDGLGISRIEIRTEESLDIRQYVHSRRIETVLFDYDAEIVMVMDLFAKALKPLVDKLCGMNAYWSRDPMKLTPYGCTQARSRWFSSDAGRKANMGLKGMVNTLFSLLASMAHGIELLKFHGIGPFYHKVLDFRNETRSAGEKASKYKKQIDQSDTFQKMMSRLQIWINNRDFIGHPKLEYLQKVVLNHFLDAGEGRGAAAPSSTRIMVFAHYRDSAEEIVRILKRQEPMIRPRVFVGQANSKGSDGMDQKTQLDAIQKFQRGTYNTLVATSIGEEGLDIGEVDLIVCYDASASPIRMLQRMGRTGRKRAGNIVVTLMKEKEADNFIKAKDNYEKMQHEIAAGSRFNFRDDQSTRIMPREIQPIVDKRVVEIPIENTQAELPEPRKRAKPPKRPAKKFHMPDGARQGFVKASRLRDDETSDDGQDTLNVSFNKCVETLEPIPQLDEVVLNLADQKDLEVRYQRIKAGTSDVVDFPKMHVFPQLQRSLRPTGNLQHGQLTRRISNMLDRMHNLATGVDPNFEKYLTPNDRQQLVAHAKDRAAFFENPIEYYQRHRSISSKVKDCAKLASPRTRTSYGRRSSTDDSLGDRQVGLDEQHSVARNDSDENGLFVKSLASSGPSKLFYQPIDTSHDDDSGSEDALPDFESLVKSRDSVSVSVSSSVDTPASNSRRKRGKRAVLDDSDDG